MAEKKRGPGRPPGSKNKTTKQSAGNKAKPSAAPKTKQEQIQDMQRQRHADRKVIDEIWAITIIALGVFFIFTIMLDTTGAFGAKVHDICMGLFGVMAYVLPFYFLTFGILLMFQKVQHINGRTAGFTIFIFVNLCILNSYRFIEESKLKFGFGDILLYYKSGVEGRQGGAIGMELGSLMVKAFGKPGLIIIALALIVISGLLVVNTPLSKWVTDLRNKREARRLLREMEEAEAKKVTNAVSEAATPGTNSITGLIEAPSVISPEEKPKTSFLTAFRGKDHKEDSTKIERDKQAIMELSKDEGLIGKDAADITYQELGKGLEEDSPVDAIRPISYGLSGDVEKHDGYGLDGYDTYFGGGSGTRGLSADPVSSPKPRFSLPEGTDEHAPIGADIGGAVTAAAISTNSKAVAQTTALEAAELVPASQETQHSQPVNKDYSEPIDTDDIATDLNSGFSSGAEDVSYKLPSTELLKKPRSSKQMMSEHQLEQRAELLEKTLKDFNVEASVTSVTQGSSVTRYEVQPAPGVKVSKITNLQNDIALNLRAKSLRIEAPIPGKAAVGIEVENEKPSPVLVRELIESAEFQNAKSKISFVVGKDISGNNIVADLKDMPHLLIAGATGSGKSVCINAIIASILYKAKPSEVKLIMIDPKVVELGNYNGIPHLLTSVVTDPRKASRALAEAVAEMDKRYDEFAKWGVKDLESFNELMLANQEPQNCKPQVVIIIDELADLMMVATSEVEASICRLAQKARAAGMHLIVATQRPSVDVVTGLIKANIPSRIAFSVSSSIDSRTILDMAGAEKLLGKGDMLFSPTGSSKPYRVQGPFISENETAQLISFVKNQCEAEYNEELSNAIEGTGESRKTSMSDELTEDAIAFIFKSKQASVSMLQRRFRIGYNRAARIIDEIEEMGIIGPSDGSRGRQLLLTEDEYYGISEEIDGLVSADTSDANDGVPEEISRYNEIIG